MPLVLPEYFVLQFITLQFINSQPKLFQQENIPVQYPPCPIPEGSFGATAVLVYGAPNVPFSQPRNVIGGHLISCFVGVACYEVLDRQWLQSPWLSVPVGASLALMSMQLTGTVHPPAGGTVLIAVLGSEQIRDLGFALLVPTLIGALLLVGVALLNNMVPSRKAKAPYPKRWF